MCLAHTRGKGSAAHWLGCARWLRFEGVGAAEHRATRSSTVLIKLQEEANTVVKRGIAAWPRHRVRSSLLLAVCAAAVAAPAAPLATPVSSALPAWVTAAPPILRAGQW